MVWFFQIIQEWKFKPECGPKQFFKICALGFSYFTIFSFS